MLGDKITSQEVIGAAESAAVNIAEAGLAGGVVGAEAAAVKELAHVVGEVVGGVMASKSDEKATESPETTLPHELIFGAMYADTFIKTEELICGVMLNGEFIKSSDARYADLVLQSIKNSQK